MAEGIETSARGGMLEWGEVVQGVPGMLSPAHQGLARGGGISNWQPGLGCPFRGVLFNCTGEWFRERAARGPYLCFHHFSFWEMKLKIPSQQLQRKKKISPISLFNMHC